MNICTTRQLEMDQFSNRAEINFQATDSDTNLTACNCDLKSYYDFYKLVFPKNCNLTTQCPSKVTEDVCLNQDDYTCKSYVYPSSLTTTTSNRITTSRPKSASNKIKSFYWGLSYKYINFFILI